MRLHTFRLLLPLISLTAAKESNSISSAASQAASAASSASSVVQNGASQASAAAGAQYSDLSVLVRELVIGKGVLCIGVDAG